MAYNPHGAYEPPRRAYYGQQQAPVHNGHSGQHQEQYNQYDQQYYDQGYDAGYDQSHGQYDRDMRQPQQPHSPDNYYGNYQGNQPTANGYGMPQQQQQQQQQDRQYDPRYRQRPEKSRQQGYEQQGRQHRAQQSPPQAHPQSIRPKPSAGRIYSPEVQPQQQQSQEQRSRPPREQRPRPPPVVNGRPQTAPQQAKATQAAKMTMEEWKAKEKARMHTEAMSPEIVSWDNAFPVFPTIQNKSRPGTANGTSEAPGRTSNDVRNDERPPVIRDDSQGNRSEPADLPQRGLERPPLDHKPFSSDAIHDQSRATHASPPPQQRPRLQRQDSNMAPIPVDHGAARQRQMQNQRQSPPNMQSAPQGYDRSFHGGGPASYEEASNTARQPRQHQPRGPPVQPIDTQHIQHHQPAFLDHQPLSPAVVIPRSASAQGGRSRTGQPVMSPTSAYSQTTPQNQFAMASQQNQQGYPQPAMNAGAHGMYNDHRIPPPQIAAPTTRAAEIESEMPDFDSAAPGGTSLLHKRSQVTRPPAQIQTQPQPVIAELPSPTPPPSQQQAPGEFTLPAPQHQRFYNHVDQSSRSLPDPRGLQQKHGGITNGHIFEVAGDTRHQQSYDPRDQQPHPQGSQLPELYGQQPQPPYARQQLPRRSMDDARPMPHRGVHPNMQRLPSNGRQPQGQYPPQQRPPVDRNFTGQTAYTDPMSERGASAPPRQAIQGPPGRRPMGGSMGAPLTQQRSHPEQPSQRHRNSNPDSLPQHPAPVRPGLLEGGPGSGGNGKPPPVRVYNNAQPTAHQRQASASISTKPVTSAELDKLRAYVSANPQNQKQALILAKKLVEAATVLASEGGRADARTTARNRERYMLDAHKMVKKLSTAGYPEAQFYLADCHGSGELGLEVDPREAFKLYQAAAKAGHGEAAYRTAMCCEMGAEESGGTSKDYAKAVQWYKRAAALGDPSGMFKVGVISLKGLLGQPRNVGEAVNWLNRSLQSGGENPHAMHELGLLYESSNTSPEVRNKVVPDDAYALELFQKASALGHKFSQFRLGQAYEYGHLGLTIDNRASISWYSKAASQGEHQAELALSGWYLTGAEGILEHSDMEAYLWARKAASSEPPLAKAMFAMAYFTETGIGCPASVDEAKKWYGRAASYNFPKARERLEELRKNGGRGSKQLANGKLSRNQKKDESECSVM